MKMNLNEFIPWQAEKSSRRVTIDIHNTIAGGRTINIWAYDSNLMVGQHVQSVSEIDLEGKQRSAELKELNRLEQKYIKLYEAKGE